MQGAVEAGALRVKPVRSLPTGTVLARTESDCTVRPVSEHARRDTQRERDLDEIVREALAEKPELIGAEWSCERHRLRSADAPCCEEARPAAWIPRDRVPGND